MAISKDDTIFDAFINKRVVIILSNGFRKYGILESHTEGFVKLLFFNSDKFEFIAKSEIMSLGPEGGR